MGIVARSLLGIAVAVALLLGHVRGANPRPARHRSQGGPAAAMRLRSKAAASSHSNAAALTNPKLRKALESLLETCKGSRTSITKANAKSCVKAMFPVGARSTEYNTILTGVTGAGTLSKSEFNTLFERAFLGPSLTATKLTGTQAHVLNHLHDARDETPGVDSDTAYFASEVSDVGFVGMPSPFYNDLFTNNGRDVNNVDVREMLHRRMNYVVGVLGRTLYLNFHDDDAMSAAEKSVFLHSCKALGAPRCKFKRIEVEDYHPLTTDQAMEFACLMRSPQATHTIGHCTAGFGRTGAFVMAAIADSTWKHNWFKKLSDDDKLQAVIALTAKKYSSGSAKELDEDPDLLDERWDAITEAVSAIHADKSVCSGM